MGETDAAITFYRKSLELLDPDPDQNDALRPGQGDLVAIEESPGPAGTVMPVVR
jgi:hypothetical protein